MYSRDNVQDEHGVCFIPGQLALHCCIKARTHSIYIYIDTHISSTYIYICTRTCVYIYIFEHIYIKTCVTKVSGHHE